MKIKKIGHCCLLIRTDKITILTDPGSFTVAQNSIIGIDVVLITHEHADHLHTDSVREILKNNPHAVVIGNSSVAKKLTEISVACTIVEGVNTTSIKDTLIEASDGRHEEIYGEIGQVQNTGYLIDNKLFYPGDSFHNPGKPVDTLALPVAGPWCRLADAIGYALAIKPKKVFPVHDGIFQPDKIGLAHRVPGIVLPQNNIEFIAMLEGDEKEF